MAFHVSCTHTCTRALHFCPFGAGLGRTSLYRPVQIVSRQWAWTIRGICWMVTWVQIHIFKKKKKWVFRRALMKRNYGDTIHNFIIVVGLRINQLLFVRERALLSSVECITRVPLGSVEQPHHYNSANKGWDGSQPGNSKWPRKVVKKTEINVTGYFQSGIGKVQKSP